MTRPTERPSEAASDDAVDLEALASRFGLRFVDAVSEDMLLSELVSGLPVEWAREHCLLPVMIDDEMCVLTSDPSAISGQEDLELLLGSELRPVLASRREILRSIEKCYFSKKDTAEDFIRDLGDGNAEKATRSWASEDLLRIAGEAPVTQLVNLILLEAVKARASDVHFEPFESRLRVRYRVDGRLYDQASPPKHMEVALVSRLKVMGHMDIAEKRLPQDGVARVRVGEREIDIRISSVPVAEGERVVLRLLDRDAALLSLTELGMSQRVLSSFRALMQQTFGLVLVTGPTGSGKTTTLYAALSEIDSNSMNIMTIENPIEYQLPGIGQIEYKPKIGLTFSTGLRHVLRQDPDVILVGETRDVETAETAARSSLTGHLVLSTLHTNDAPSAVVRIVDMGVAPYLLAASLKAVLAQRLVRRLCPECREQVTLGAAEVKPLGRVGAKLAGRSAWAANGCPECLDGYKGRIGVYELMVLDAEIQDAIRRGQCNLGEMRRLARANGMSSLLEDGIEKVLDGTTSLSEVIHTLGQTGIAVADDDA